MAPETRANINPVTTQPGIAFHWWLTVLAIGFFAVLAALCGPQFLGGPLKAGDLAGSDIVAGRSAEVEDQEATRKAREQARLSVMQVFKRDGRIDDLIKRNLHVLLGQVSTLQKGAGLPLPDWLQLTAQEQVYVIESPDAVWQKIKQALTSPRSAQGHILDAQQQSTATEDSAQTSEHLGRGDKILSKLKQKLSGGAHQKGGKSAAQNEGGANDLFSQIERARQAYRASGVARNRDLLFLSVSVKPDAWTDMSAVVEQAIARMLRLGPLFPDTPPSDWERTIMEFLPDSWRGDIRFTCAKVAASCFQTDVVVDTAATRVKADNAAVVVQPLMRKVTAGELIVPKGSIITADKANLLSQLGITRTPDWALVLSLALSLMAASTFFGLFLHTYAPKHLYSPSSIGLLFTVSAITCGISAFIGESYSQFVPIPAAALISTVFFGPRVATALIIMLLIFLKVDNLIDSSNLMALATASTVAIGANIKQRHELMFRGFLIGVMQAAGFLCAVILFHAGLSAATLGQQLLLQILGGLSSCIVAIGSLPFLEDIFGMVTPFRITELTASDQPLLRKLEENAPGTYQHSLAVANLAESGARAIGADVTLVRAGSLYHDIGKMVRPKYFIENQLGDTNPHDAMSPEESRDRVLAHVTDGMVLAQKYGLPRVVQDFIPQHQGTTLMAYFYHKACLRDGAENVDTQFYRYPGPKPQSREAAIVMLADVSEAVTHSMNDPTQEEVDVSIGTVFKARWDDGQFNEAGLTKEELEKVKKAFVRVWRTLHHERLKYPSTTTGRMPVAPEPPPKAPTVSQSSQQVQE